MERVFIAIGSNKGRRSDNVIDALRKMERGIAIRKVSPFFTTPPAEGAKGGVFINGAIEGVTSLSPDKLLLFLHGIEKSMGREFPHKIGDERTIDLDIIFYGNRIIKTETLTIPHHRYRTRNFMVFPLYEIAPDISDPETGETISDIYLRLVKNGNY
ncbi:MAG: 2-amino-4-hydroxy-6-hydroxymethyldihydropteridine diphosphokinase [Elusimicrobia bacterium]|nr:2-amino-4-hydroxy-6-hydroxymethyldihydropteridine diphosphokinase [Elusimicrobiota bacterium]